MLGVVNGLHMYIVYVRALKNKIKVAMKCLYHVLYFQCYEPSSPKVSGAVGVGIGNPWGHPGRRISLADDPDPDSDEENNDSPFMAKIISADKKGSTRRKKRRRVVEKDGSTNIQYKNISKRRRRYLDDFYTTLVDSRYVPTYI